MLHRKPLEETSLDRLIDEMQTEMRQMSFEDKEFQLVLARLKELHKLKDESRPKRVSNDTLALIGANLLGIAIIVGYEHAHVMTSKATGFLKRL
jgi:hypothetical protein